MRWDSFDRFYYEKVSLEGCGCAEYVSTRLSDLDGLAVNAEVRGIAWTARPERRSVWVRLADRIRGLGDLAWTQLLLISRSWVRAPSRSPTKTRT